MFGFSKLWQNSLKDIDVELIKLVAKAWPIVITSLSNQDSEDSITKKLVIEIKKIKSVTNIATPVYHYEILDEDIHGTVNTKGVVDIAFILDNSQTKYIAYEAKRLNEVGANNIRKASLAGVYLDQGLKRYVTEKYGGGLGYGCMLGYVLDGDTKYAKTEICKHMLKPTRKQNLNVISHTKLNLPNTWLETEHSRPSMNNIRIRHHMLVWI